MSISEYGSNAALRRGAFGCRPSWTQTSTRISFTATLKDDPVLTMTSDVFSVRGVARPELRLSERDQCRTSSWHGPSSTRISFLLLLKGIESKKTSCNYSSCNVDGIQGHTRSDHTRGDRNCCLSSLWTEGRARSKSNLVWLSYCFSPLLGNACRCYSGYGATEAEEGAPT